jgi:Zn-dependent peptidase ImmA (M78 family)/DNA-binding XRE family transcriptional regulator
MAEIPVSRAVLQWARKFRGLSEEEAAQRLNITIQELREYEAGQRKPTLTMFEAFAAKYRLPQAALFRLTPPQEPPKPNDYRTFESRRAKHSFDFNVALSTVRAWLFYLDRVIREDSDFVPPHLATLDPEHDDPAEAGERERRRLGVSVQRQIDWRSDEAFRQWRARIERRGVFVFQQKFPLEDCRGFTLYENDSTPSIVVNKAEQSDGAKSFTLIHEYCHLLIRKPGVSDHNNRSPVETYCNKFAAAFLIPTEALREVLPYWPNEPVDWPMSAVSEWARKLKVSRQALAIRLEDMELAPEGSATAFLAQAAQPRSPREREDRKPNYVRIRLSEIGGNFSDKVVGALDRGIIDEVEATEILGISADHLNTVRDTVKRQREMAGA